MKLDVMREVRHNAIAPFGGLELAAYVFPHAPVKVDQFGIDGLIGTPVRLLDEAQHLVK